MDDGDWLETVQETAAVPPCSCKRSFTASFSKQCSRFERWEKISRAKETAEAGRYAALIQEACAGSAELKDKEKQLQVDVERTCPSLTFFSEGCSGRASLYNILRAWVVYDAQESAKAGTRNVVGYVQGMNFLVTVLLWHAVKEEDAFWIFVSMMQSYGLRCMYEPPDMCGLKMRSSTMSQLLHQEMPDLSGHLAEYLRNSFGLLITEWLLTLFAGSIPLGPLSAFWDHFFEEGYRAVYRLILARLRCLAPSLMAETDFASLVYLVKNAHVDFDCSTGDPTAMLLGHSGLPVEAVRRKKSLLKRWVSTARKHFEKESSKDIELTASSSSGVDPDEAGAWTCMACNGSEMCRSWDVLVNVLLAAEDISGETVRHFESMFSSSNVMALRKDYESIKERELRDAEDSSEACATEDCLEESPECEKHIVADCSDGSGPLAEGSQESLAKENADLRMDNEQLRATLQQVQEDLKLAREEIVRLRGGIECHSGHSSADVPEFER